MAPATDRKIKVLYCQPGTTVFAGIERVNDAICTELARTYGDTFDVDVLLVSEHRNHPPLPRTYSIVRRPGSTHLGLISGVPQRRSHEKRYDLVVVPQIESTVIFFGSSRPPTRCGVRGVGRRRSRPMARDVRLRVVSGGALCLLAAGLSLRIGRREPVPGLVPEPTAA